MSSPAPKRRISRLKLVAWVLLAIAAVVLLLALVAGLWSRSQLVASLPQLDGERVLAGLVAPVRIERDALGVPTVHGASRPDVARALGFLHAQDRFFQMDLLRRRAAGELSELFGRATLSQDREIRVHRFRTVAKRVQQSTPADERTLVEAYAAGVNAGLAALNAKPFEYLVLRTDPAPWLPEDTVLVVLAMFIQLHDSSGRRESHLGVMHDVLPPKLFELLAPRGTEWDAPLFGEPVPAPSIPGPEVFDLRAESASEIESLVRLVEAESEEALEAVGSNNWAVAASHSATGHALLANDMHLGLSVPNTWYRAVLTWPSANGSSDRWISGVTLPGTPAVVVGTNRHIAWGFTNSQGDWNDLIILEPDTSNPDAYRTPEGPRTLQRDLERIRVKGAPDDTLEVFSTVWGPVIDQDHRGRRRVLRWTAHDPEAINNKLQQLEDVRTLEDAVELAHRAGVPPQNFVCADATGRIAWTLTGKVPRRLGFDGEWPTSWADGSRRWEGWLRPEEYPQIIDPPVGRLWTANARVVEGEMLTRLGDGGYANGARARQIRDALLSLPHASPRDMLQIQLDDRALFLARWREVLLKSLTEDALATHPLRRELKRHVENWGGHASIDSVGYRAVRMFHHFLERQVFGALTARCKVADPRFDYFRAVSQREAPLWKLVSERPMHLLAPRFKSWDEQLLAAVDAMLDSLVPDGTALAKRTWGEHNTSRIKHPLTRAISLLRPMLDMPSEPLPGDVNMPRVQAHDFGASERLVVSPGNEGEGFFHTPGGQSGHPLSPYYRAGHRAWAHGEPTPFLPGPVQHVLELYAPQAQ